MDSASESVSTDSPARPEWKPPAGVGAEVVERAGHPIQVAWKELARHAEGCEPCAEVVAVLCGVPDEPRAADAELHPRLCVDGRELHGAWVAAKAEMFEAAKPGRARIGVLGADQDAVALRDAAWASLTDPERRRYLELPAAERFRLLEAIEAGLRRRAVTTASTDAPERRADPRVGTASRERAKTCATCGRAFSGGGRYCSAKCRQADQLLEDTE